jgi:ABC-type dipeptide/oligopeptide/nickel transport system ATPase component
MVKVAPYRNNADYDEWLEKTVDATKQHIKINNDDALLIIVGETGSGKSNLGLHIFERYLGNEADVKYIGLNKPSIAEGIKFAKDKPLPRCFFSDEANINKRESLSKFNKDTIDLYLAIRGLNMLHVWCNPSLDMMDKHFIEERIKGVLFCVKPRQKNNINKSAGRVYYFFQKKDILLILAKYGHLKLPLLYKVRGKYAYYSGWYKEYNGFIKEEYLKKKESRMDEKVEEFFVRWGNLVNDKGLLKQKQVADFLGVTVATIKKYAKELEKRDILEEGLNKFTHINGRTSYKETTLDDFENLAKEYAEKIKSGFKKNGTNKR